VLRNSGKIVRLLPGLGDIGQILTYPRASLYTWMDTILELNSTSMDDQIKTRPDS